MDYILKYAVDPSKTILQCIRCHDNWLLCENGWYYIEIAIEHNMPNVIAFHINRIGTAKVSHCINEIIEYERPKITFFTGLEEALDPDDFKSILYSAVEKITEHAPLEYIKSLHGVYPHVVL